MDFSKFKKLTIGGVELKQLFINGIQIWKSGYKNWAKHSTAEPNGTVIYNSGKGYKDGYRIRSGGNEAELVNTSCTGFIPAPEGSIVGLGGVNFTYKNNTINVYNGSECLGQIADNYGDKGYGIFADGNLSSWSKGTMKDGCYYWQIPNGANITHIRVTGRTSENVSYGADMIVTINEEIT